MAADNRITYVRDTNCQAGFQRSVHSKWYLVVDHHRIHHPKYPICWRIHVRDLREAGSAETRNTRIHKPREVHSQVPVLLFCTVLLIDTAYLLDTVPKIHTLR